MKMIKETFLAKLFPHQKSARATIATYLEQFDSLKGDGCAVICHPTGSGKTFIIAGVAQFPPASEMSRPGGCLIVSPRSAIRDQLVVELGSGIFVDKLGLPETAEVPKTVFCLGSLKHLNESAADNLNRALRRLVPARLERFQRSQNQRILSDENEQLLDTYSAGRGIAICTIQWLERLRREHRDDYRALKDATGMVLFDEGHYEPAVSWSRTIRSINCPTILLSATPFRNDLRSFLVSLDKENSHFDIYHYKDAKDAGYIRNVKVEVRPFFGTADGFVEDVNTVCSARYGKRDAWPRIIVSCSDANSIREVGKAFISREFSVMAVHEKFRNSASGDNNPSWQRKDLPAPRETDAQVWIHQRKLLEGIDDPRFQVLALYDPLRNGRELVQQIGRVLRKSRNDQEEEEALVLDYFRGQIRSDWNAFLRYDKELKRESLEKMLSRKSLYAKLLDWMPEVEYQGGRFRRRFDLSNFSPVLNDILIKKQVYLRRTGDDFSLQAVTAQQMEEIERNCIDAKCVYQSGQVSVIVVLREASPDFLNTSYYVQPKHQLKVIAHLPHRSVLAIYDSENQGLGAGISQLPRLSYNEISRLVGSEHGDRVLSASSRNTNLSNRVVRTRAVRAPSLEAVPSSLDDHGHVLANVTGWERRSDVIHEDHSVFLSEISGDQPEELAQRILGAEADEFVHDREFGPVRRYVSLSTGRISETGPQLRLPYFLAWLEGLLRRTEGDSQFPDSRGIFNRYASSTEIPADPLAQNLLLDLYDIEDDYEFVTIQPESGGGESEGRKPLEHSDLCLDRRDVDSSGSEPKAVFCLELNGQEFEVHLSFNRSAGRYRFEPAPDSGLDDLVRPAKHGDVPFSRRINQSQSFNVLPEDLSRIYVHGSFFAPGLRFGDDFNEAHFFVGKCLVPCARLEGVSEEKGRHVCLADGSASTSRMGESYAENTLFNLIDSWGDDAPSDLGIAFDQLGFTSVGQEEQFKRSVGFNPTLLVCDDMDKESADFLLASEDEGVVALVHAKASSSRRPYSASALQEVCAQAQKNSNLFSFFSLAEPSNLARWNRPHRFNSLSVRDRVRIPRGESAEAVWERLKDLLLNPQTRKEIWIVLGNTLSNSEVREQIQSPTPVPEVIQLNHLIETTIANAGSLGAKLRIFCMP
jgi:superfamily II DNA or RNA helicase